MAACIFPGTRSALNFFGMSAVRCGMWRSPITRTSTWTSKRPRVWTMCVASRSVGWGTSVGWAGSSPCAEQTARCFGVMRATNLRGDGQ